MIAQVPPTMPPLNDPTVNPAGSLAPSGLNLPLNFPMTMPHLAMRNPPAMTTKNDPYKDMDAQVGAIEGGVGSMMAATLPIDLGGFMIAPMAIGGLGAGVSWLGFKGAGDSLRGAAKKLNSVNEITISDTAKKLGVRNAIKWPAKMTMSVAAAPVGLLQNIPGISHARNWRAESLTRTTVNHIGGAVEELTAAATKLGDGHAAKPMIDGLIGELKTTVPSSKMMEKFGELAGHEALKNEKAVLPHLDKAAKSLGKATTAFDASSVWKNPAKAIRRIPNTMGKLPLKVTAINGLQTVSSVTQAYFASRKLTHEFETLSELYAELTGKPPESVTSTDVLFGDAPKIITQARRQLMAEYGARSLLNVANIGMNLLSFVSGHWSMLRFMALSAAEAGVGAFIGESFLEKYKEMKDTQTRGQVLQPKEYLDLLSELSPTLRAQGGPNSEFTKALALQYTQMQAPPVQLVRELENGMMAKRLEQLKHQAPAAPEGQLTALNTQEAPAQTNFTQRVQSQREAAPANIPAPRGQMSWQAHLTQPASAAAVAGLGRE